ncbi:MAG: type II toxin-antitoxin system VapC family toxin [Bryobacteraceae bacterium]|nr:type II toxin-antitoxin system VapC family toxin [Bryobacteraceae bacterium]
MCEAKAQLSALIELLLWWLDDNPALSRAARELIAQPENTIFVSAATMWEIWLKASLGKLRLPAGFEPQLAAAGFESLPVSAAHARHIERLPWLHRDPFDRMLIAQAAVSGLTLLSANSALGAYGRMVHAV